MVALLRFLYVFINRQVNDIYVPFITAFLKIPNLKEREIEITFFMVYYGQGIYNAYSSKCTRTIVSLEQQQKEERKYELFLFFKSVRWAMTVYILRQQKIKKKISCSLFLYTIIKVHYHLNAQQPIEIKVKLIDIQLLKRRQQKSINHELYTKICV